MPFAPGRFLNQCKRAAKVVIFLHLSVSVLSLSATEAMMMPVQRPRACPGSCAGRAGWSALALLRRPGGPPALYQKMTGNAAATQHAPCAKGTQTMPSPLTPRPADGTGAMALNARPAGNTTKGYALSAGEGWLTRPEIVAHPFSRYALYVRNICLTRPEDRLHTVPGAS